jgi:Cys-rich four helix bundle protein (predicted Tat secretion target)
MDRRTVLAGMGAAVLAGVSTARAEMDMKNMNHDHMDMKGMHHHHSGPMYQSLVDSSSACIAKGEACLAHCLVLLGEGDKSMADCSKSVNQMLAVCAALESLAAQNAPALPKMARVAAEVCKQCEDACRKHEKEHQECKDCAEACAKCGDECKKVAA